jgi:small GTP-binding protein
VGKTSLLDAFVHQQYAGQVVPTVAPAFTTARVSLSEGEVDFQIWDTAGQEQYRSISQMSYREAHVAFMCFCCLDASTVPTWASRVSGLVPARLIFLVGTKADLISETPHLQILTRESLELAEECDPAFFLRRR